VTASGFGKRAGFGNVEVAASGFRKPIGCRQFEVTANDFRNSCVRIGRLLESLGQPPFASGD
jgi:hypothetical protein